MQPWKLAPVAGAILIASLGTGCATKKYVRQQVDPVTQRVSEVEQQSNQKIAALDEKTTQGLSRVEEKAMSADNRAGQAGQAAEKASQQATEAGRHAADARGLAEKGLTRSEELARTIENLDNYQQLSSESVLFGFGKATLTDEGKAKLDTLAQALNANKHFVLQVEGYTDSTGSEEYNLELSRRRANAVVNYLTLQHKIPLYRIHMAGFGKETPVAENKSRDGRKQNRRVDVRVFTPQQTASSAQTTAGTASSGAPTQ
jgi:OmpA-OmpF porin, OOP family